MKWLSPRKEPTCSLEVGAAIIEAPVWAFIVFSAISNLLILGGLSFSVPFLWIAIAISTIFVLVLIYLVLVFMAWLKAPSSTLSSINMAALCLSVIAGSMTASIHRPDMDDSIYVPKALFYRQHPEASLDHSITWIAGLPETVISMTVPYFEYIQAAIAWFMGVEYLTVYHILSPFVVGAIAFLTSHLLLTMFWGPKPLVLWGAVIFFLLSMTLGETHRTYGNISVARMFQGKFVFMTSGVLLWIALSLRYLRFKGLAVWLFLAVAGLAMIGFSTTALMILPLLSLILFVAYFLGWPGVNRGDWISVGFRYGLAVFPVLLAAWFYRGDALKKVPSGAAIHAGFERDFFGQLGYLINPSLPVTAILFMTSLVLIMISNDHRRFLLWWLALPLVFLLNPWVASFVMQNVSTENIYWRLFYLLPFPLMVVLSMKPLLSRIRPYKCLEGLVLAVAFWGAFWGPSSILRAENGAILEFPKVKIGEPVRSVVRKLAEQSSPGAMFAPLEIASNIVLLTSNYQQVYFREEYLQWVLSEAGQADSFLQRSRAAKFLYQNVSSPQDQKAFERLFSAIDRPRYVVVRDDISLRPLEALENLGYRETGDLEYHYRLFVRDVTP